MLLITLLVTVTDHRSATDKPHFKSISFLISLPSSARIFGASKQRSFLAPRRFDANNYLKRTSLHALVLHLGVQVVDAAGGRPQEQEQNRRETEHGAQRRHNYMTRK